MELWIIILRTFILYLFILVVLRVMGKREIGKLSVFDLVVSIMIAELAVISLEDVEVPMIYSIAPILILMLIQVSLAYLSLKSQKIRDVVDGKPSILIRNGKIKEDELRKQRYSLDDLLIQLREKNIHSPSQVEYAILEPTGRLTVLPIEEEQTVTKKDLDMRGSAYSLPEILVKDGVVQEQSLKKLNKSLFWLKSEIKKRAGSSNIKKVSFCSVDEKGHWYIDIDDRKE
ncbi:DUF421 domain-containing protein [Caldalkalibacillus salinus]|uniref:DUF421 domain-containing protein n=1 Tax=Caldalkalibacillus salinus TaxID=2803787 RepID=UPI0019221624|nr:DUF421 domain-containing protein [Caldalkalibacillus salinus]